MNNVSLIGRITKEIELRTTQSGLSCVSLYIAINNGKDKDGNDRQADFPKIVIYDKQAENVGKYCHKGSLIAITGRVRTHSWDKEDGSKAYETYIEANRVQFLDTKQGEGAPIPEPSYTPNQESNTGVQEESDPFKDFGNEVVLTDDDLPF